MTPAAGPMATSSQAISRRWVIITGEYPPQPGGVADYSRLIARGLVAAGDSVTVFAPPAPGADPSDKDVEVRRLPDRFGLRSLRAIDAYLDTHGGSPQLLVQYVPHAFGRRAMNVSFCLWLWRRRARRPFVVFHEVAFPIQSGARLRHQALGLVTHAMAAIVERASAHSFIPTAAWKTVLRRVAGRKADACAWMPVPSNIDCDVSNDERHAARSRLGAPPLRLIGHFGTFGQYHNRLMRRLVPELLAGDSDRVMLLVGRGSDAFRDRLVASDPNLAPRVIARGAVSATDAARVLSACDLLVQPYEDGISGRRASALAGLALGRPVVSTVGRLSEAMWQTSDAVSLVPAEDVEATSRALASRVDALLNAPETAAALADRGATLYRARFDVSHTIRALRAAAAQRAGSAP